MSTIKRVAFVGLGTMGRAMVQNLLQAEFSGVVYNRDRSDSKAMRSTI